MNVCTITWMCKGIYIYKKWISRRHNLSVHCLYYVLDANLSKWETNGLILAAVHGPQAAHDQSTGIQGGSWGNRLFCFTGLHRSRYTILMDIIWWKLTSPFVYFLKQISIHCLMSVLARVHAEKVKNLNFHGFFNVTYRFQT